MIANKNREIRKNRTTKMTKNTERLLREGKCRECSVVVTRMDFARILGKFTKVKIQYETSSTPKAKGGNPDVSPNSNSRLKNNENGMVLLHRSAYNQHPVKEILNEKKTKNKVSVTPRSTNNILKENNRLKRTPMLIEKGSNTKMKPNTNLKRYGIVFVDPVTNNNNNELKNKISLTELLPLISNNILPTEDWCIDFCPKSEECKEDKVYDRIAAELEDLMYSEKIKAKSEQINESTENKTDDFPSIMDILNENTTKTEINAEQSTADEFKPNLESSDVEAMLLGKSNDTNKTAETTSIDVDNTDMTTLMEDVAQLNPCKIQETCAMDTSLDNPQSPSILDEALQKGIEENIPFAPSQKVDDKTCTETKVEINSLTALKPEEITHVIFKQSVNGACHKTVICPKSLKYSVELEGKPVEFLGAPKYISSLEDLKVLLQIVNESELDSLYVLQ